MAVRAKNAEIRTITGNLSGNATSATTATNDTKGQAITSYIRALSISGRTITYTKGDGTTGTITTQDTNTTYTLAGLVGSTAIGSTTQPIYWDGSKFTTIGYTIAKSVPSNAIFTDQNVTQVLSETSDYRPLLMGETHLTTTDGLGATITSQVRVNPKIYAQTGTGTIFATKFKGALEGNASTATTAIKLGTSTVGGTAKPIYLNAGTATALSATVGGTTQPVYLNAGTITASNASVGNSATPVYMENGVIKSTGKSFSSYVLKRENGCSYNHLANYYPGGNTPTIIRIYIPKQSSAWTMCVLEMTLKENHGNATFGKIVFHGNWSSTAEWNNLYAETFGRLTDVTMYASDKQYIYIKGSFSWPTLTVDKMLIGDNATGYDLSGITIDNVTALPTTYQTVTMQHGILSSEVNVSSVANTIVKRDANHYVYLNYIHSSTSNNENPTISQVIVTNGSDNFYRKASLAHLKSALGSMTPASHNHYREILQPDHIEFGTYTTGNHGGVIDFHYNGSTADYTSRIIESASGTISINGVTVNGSTITGSLSGNATSATTASTCSGNAASASTLLNPGQLTTTAALDGFLEANRFKYATIGAISGLSGTYNNNDGIILSAAWESTSWGHQIFIDDSGYSIHHRYKKSSDGWQAWAQIIDSTNYKSYCTPANIGAATTAVATTSANGLMSAADKKKLDGIASGANAYTHPSHTAYSSGLYKVTVNALGHVTAATAVTKADITALGIPGSDTNTWRGVQDNLTSTATDQSLSANQGRILKGLVDNKAPLYRQTIDLSSSTYDVNKYYAVTGSGIPSSGGFHKISVAVQLNSGTKPSWSTHSGGFTCNMDILDTACGWGTTAGECICLRYSYSFTSTCPVSYSQMGNSSTPVIWCRGGGLYYVYTDYDCAWTPRTSDYTSNSQTITSPQSSLPALSLNNKAAIYANLNGNATSANTAATATTASYVKYIHSDEINFSGNDTTTKVYFNWRNQSSDAASGNTAITRYLFGNRNGGTGGVTLQADYFTGTAATATSAGALSSNDGLSYGWNGLQYFNLSTSTTSGAKANAVPNSGWHHIIRMNHGNSDGYFCDMAFPLNNAALDPAYRVIIAGSENVTWRTFLTSYNYASYTVKKDGTGATGTWGISITGNAATATNASKLGGLAASHATGASTIVTRDGSGYTYLNYINSNTSNNENPTISQIIVTNGSDNFYRKASLAHLKSSLGSMPASDVYSWAKASAKPTYTASEVGAAAASHTHSGYAASSHTHSGYVATSGGAMTGALKVNCSNVGTDYTTYRFRNIGFGTTSTPTSDSTYGGNGAIYFMYS